MRIGVPKSGSSGHVLPHRVVNRELPVLREQGDGRGGELLRHRSRLEDGARPDADAVLQVGHAVALGVDDLAALRTRRRHTRASRSDPSARRSCRWRPPRRRGLLRLGGAAATCAPRERRWTASRGQPRQHARRHAASMHGGAYVLRPELRHRDAAQELECRVAGVRVLVLDIRPARTRRRRASGRATTPCMNTRPWPSTTKFSCSYGCRWCGEWPPGVNLDHPQRVHRRPVMRVVDQPAQRRARRLLADDHGRHVGVVTDLALRLRHRITLLRTCLQTVAEAVAAIAAGARSATTARSVTSYRSSGG